MVTLFLLDASVNGHKNGGASKFDLVFMLKHRQKKLKVFHCSQWEWYQNGGSLNSVRTAFDQSIVF